MSEKQNKINPYTDSKRKWNEEYANYVVQARNWRFFSLFTLLVALFSVGGMIYVASLPKIKPYIVTIDKIGTPIAAMPVPSMKADEKVIKYALADFVTNFRTVYILDSNVQRQMVNKAYNYLGDYPATQQVTQIYRSNPPFGGETSRQINVGSVLNVGKDQYQIDWTENTFNKDGNLLSKENYRAVATIAINPPATEKDIMKNPIGLFIKDIAFQKTLN